jgi:hypothetical protein
MTDGRIPSVQEAFAVNAKTNANPDARSVRRTLPEIHDGNPDLAQHAPQ